MKSIQFSNRLLFHKLNQNEVLIGNNFANKATRHNHYRISAYKSIILLVIVFVFGMTAMAQNPTTNDLWNNHNLIKNWNFTIDLTFWGGWWDGTTQIPPVVQDGVAVMQTGINSDGNSWHYQLNQSGLKAESNVPYTLKFKSWSSKTRSNGLNFEDSPGNSYNRY